MVELVYTVPPQSFGCDFLVLYKSVIISNRGKLIILLAFVSFAVEEKVISNCAQCVIVANDHPTNFIKGFFFLVKCKKRKMSGGSIIK